MYVQIYAYTSAFNFMPYFKLQTIYVDFIYNLIFYFTISLLYIISHTNFSLSFRIMNLVLWKMTKSALCKSQSFVRLELKVKQGVFITERTLCLYEEIHMAKRF